MLELKAGLENMKLYGFISCHETFFFFQFEKCEAVEQAKKMMGMMPPQMLQTSEAQDCPCRPTNRAVINTETTSPWGGFRHPKRRLTGGKVSEEQAKKAGGFGELDIPGRKCW